MRFATPTPRVRFATSDTQGALRDIRHPGCASRPWALMCNAFGVEMRFSPVSLVEKRNLGRSALLADK